MTKPIRVLPLHMGKDAAGPGVHVIPTISKGGYWSQLSPFLLGPCKLYDGFDSRNMENAWQYSKVYAEHDNGGEPSKKWWVWASRGWTNPRAVRYPMGKGTKPEYSWWDGHKLTYIQARKVIYGPLYAEAVQKTEAYRRLVKLYRAGRKIVLLDYDAYDHRALGMSLTQVLNDPIRKMGHAFVLAMLLQDSRALTQMDLR